MELKTNLHTYLKANLTDFALTPAFGQRSVGDKIESLIGDLVAQAYGATFAPAPSKRAIEDFSLTQAGQRTFCDVKTHFIQADGFSMPNLISVKRLRKLLLDPNQALLYIFVAYERDETMVYIKDLQLHYIWELAWESLGIGALGKGQLQIKNANLALTFTEMGREAWTAQLQGRVLAFYQQELKKITAEIKAWT